VLDFATVRGYRTGDNPARWKGHIENVLPSRSKVQQTNHHAALPFAKIPTFIASLQQREGVAARALEFLILCASRTGEVIGTTWNEIDLVAKTWTIPAERMKAKKEHRVPLSDRALEILRALPREDGNDFVFIGPRKNGLSNMAMATVLRRMERDDITVHGFRSSFRDWAAERTGHANFVVEMALAHTVGNAVEAAYRRGDLFEKRMRLMGEWARFCTTGTPNTTSNLVSIRRDSEDGEFNRARLASTGSRAG
jgi:integrase